MKQPFELCPKFINCSVNRCPMHPDYLRLESIPEDKEKACRLSKDKRLLIASQFPDILETNGLTVREYSMSQNALSRKKSALNPHIQSEVMNKVSLPNRVSECEFKGGAA